MRLKSKAKRLLGWARYHILMALPARYMPDFLLSWAGYYAFGSCEDRGVYDSDRLKLAVRGKE